MELQRARYLDPSNTVLRDRMAELSAAQTGSIIQSAAEPGLAGQVELDYQSGTRKFDYRGDTQGAYEEAGRQFGVEVAFDVQLVSRPVRIQVDAVDFPTLMRLLGDATGTILAPADKASLFRNAGDAAKTEGLRRYRRPHSFAPRFGDAGSDDGSAAHGSRYRRDYAHGIGHTQPHAHVARFAAGPGVATQLIDEVEQPLGPVMVLEIEILEVDRAYASQIGITPPQSAQVHSLDNQELQQAEQGGQSLINVIGQIFGLPSALSGLSASQLGSLLASNQISAASLLPPPGCV